MKMKRHPQKDTIDGILLCCFIAAIHWYHKLN